MKHGGSNGICIMISDEIFWKCKSFHFQKKNVQSTTTNHMIGLVSQSNYSITLVSCTSDTSTGSGVTDTRIFTFSASSEAYNNLALYAHVLIYVLCTRIVW